VRGMPAGRVRRKAALPVLVGQAEALAAWVGALPCRENDLEVNPTREKALTNVRAAGADEKVFLAPPRLMTLEDAIG
jgi:predicted membrane GTPase involved in stress response